MELLTEIGARFSKLRKRKGYTAEMVADLCGIMTITLSMIERGQYKPPYSVYEEMCRVLGTKFGDFMSVYRWTYAEPEKEETFREVA